ncbi:MAG TPA: hypothetical protein VNJ08_00540 [Bacteriovoracaceae bacterium]|nr:hypothetical protein [Bacteriovoracaceae bacterium]
MKRIILCIAILGLSLCAFAQAEDEMKLEGSCNGNYTNGKPVSFTYFSNFNGCQQKIKAAIKFAPDSGSQHHKGNRAFENNQDIYTLGTYQVSFADSTDIKEGIFSYLNDGKRESIIVKCVIRNYEYYECPN